MRSAVISAVRRALRGPGAPCAGQRLVVALSGGADSLALLDALGLLAPGLGLELVAAHLDHGLRPESAADAAFCARLCAERGLPLVAGRADVRARADRERGGLEQAARRERYAFLRRVKREQGAVAVAVAHTRDDQAETVLLRLLRGSGARGLAAMRPRVGDLLRPLLAVSRADVLAHLRARGLSWREDESNADPRFARNRVRLELLPALEERFGPGLRRGLCRAAALLAEDDRALEARARARFARLCRREPDGLALPLDGLRAAPAAVARRLVRRALRAAGGLRGVGAVHVERVLELARSAAPSGRRVSLPGGREASFRFEHVHFGRAAAPAPPFAARLAVPGRVDLPDGRTLVARAAGARAGAGRAALLELDGPLEVRSRRPGDRLRVRGRERSLKSLLLEARVPAELRGGWPVVTSAGRVVWVPDLGLRPPAPAPGAPRVRLELIAATGKGARP